MQNSRKNELKYEQRHSAHSFESPDHLGNFHTGGMYVGGQSILVDTGSLKVSFYTYSANRE